MICSSAIAWSIIAISATHLHNFWRISIYNLMFINIWTLNYILRFAKSMLMGFLSDRQNSDGYQALLDEDVCTSFSQLFLAISHGFNRRHQHQTKQLAMHVRMFDYQCWGVRPSFKVALDFRSVFFGEQWNNLLTMHISWNVLPLYGKKAPWSCSLYGTCANSSP